MQNKGAVRLFAILLAIVCVYQLSFTIFTKSVENSAKEYAKGDVKLESLYLDSMNNEEVYPLLVKNFTYAECKDREINLGLDLKGGMNVTLEVSVPEIVRAMGNYSTDANFNKALETAISKERNSQLDFVTLFGNEFKAIAPNDKLAAIFSTVELQNKINYNSTNDQVLAVLKTEVNESVDRSYNTIKTRIDKFGVTQPNVQKLANGRILVELPGVKEKERVRKLLQGTAKLEFWPTYNFGEVVKNLVEVNKVLKVSAERDSLLNKPASDSTSAAIAVADTNVTKVDSAASGLLSKIDEAAKDTSKKDTTKTMTMEESLKEYPLFTYLLPSDFQVKTADDQKAVYGQPVLGYCSVKDTAKVNEIFRNPEVKAVMPNNLKLCWTYKASQMFKDNRLELIAIKIESRDGRAPLDGSAVRDARQDFGQMSNAPEITMQMNEEGASKWARLTKENIKRNVAIVLDDLVYSFPTVQNEISGGNSSITGNFTINEAKDLANILTAGKLAAPCRIVEESVVGPTLGEQAIKSGLLSFVIAVLLVLVFMIVYYSNAGWVADLAMFANVFFVFGVLASIGAVLTLPGIAGIVLIIALSVDANVLIYERIREELTAGKGLRLAISDGYKHALSAIIDSNVTTFLIGVVLYVFGTGPIQGFATTLCIGILTSLFCAIFITRLIFEWRLSKNKAISFSTKLSEGAWKSINIDWVKNRKWYYILSGVVIAIGIVSMVTRGFDYGVDFAGGRTYKVVFKQEVKGEDVRAQLTPVLGSAPEVKTLENKNTLKITTKYLVDSKDPDADNKAEAKLMEGLGITKDQIVSSQKVGPTVADDIRNSAWKAILFSIFIIFVYLLARFRKWTFGLGAVVALVHDVLLIMTLFSLFWGYLPFSLEMDQAFVAAVLTVMGYSVTDTVVVFDRIREYLNLHKKGDSKTVINEAINSTLSRTINTSLTVFFVLLAIFIFGGETIKGFSFALLIGIVVGTYSSICIATPIVIDFSGKDKEIKH
ncbi:MAG: protein translocase subunit SecDF [Bacteroidia bacterium]|nr:protein translocase subunit SecDF [Bacteroidia bacterium]